MLKKLIKQNVQKEIFVIIDEATLSFQEKIKVFTNHVNFVFNKERIGKANALNNTVPLSSGKVLVFLDSDVDIDDDPDFLKKIIMEIQNVDVLDIKKQVVKTSSFLSTMAYYEYFSFNLSSWLLSKVMKKCPALNGSAFAIKRETFENINGFRPVVAEDFDIATRVFLIDGSFAYTSDVGVKNEVISDWKKWFKQRNRWAIGQALWVKEWYRAREKSFTVNHKSTCPAYSSCILQLQYFLSASLCPTAGCTILSCS